MSLDDIVQKAALSSLEAPENGDVQVRSFRGSAKDFEQGA